MIHKVSLKDQIRSLCADPGEDDGKDPHASARRRAHGRRGGSVNPQIRRVDRKACQLCRQVALTLDAAFADCGDPVLQNLHNLHAASVAPYPDGSRLLVTVSSIDGGPGPAGGPSVVLEHLDRAGGHLRCEVAAAVTRKRAPLLFYRVAEPAISRSSP
jgi:ribosome-binding factor A